MSHNFPKPLQADISVAYKTLTLDRPQAELSSPVNSAFTKLRAPLQQQNNSCLEAEDSLRSKELEEEIQMKK